VQGNAVPIAARFKHGSVPGYLIAGIAISPVLTLLSVDIVSLQHIAKFGVVMMLYQAPAMKSVRRPMVIELNKEWARQLKMKKAKAEETSTESDTSI